MDCPHCGVENLIGATRCAACGKSMVTRPKFLPTEQALPTDTAIHAAPRAQRSPTVRSTAEQMAAMPVAPWEPPPSAPAAGPDPAGQFSTMCRVCREPFDRAPDTPDETICGSCRSLSAQVERMAPNEVQIAPATAAEGEAEFRNRLGSSALRPKPIAQRKVGLRAGPVAAIVGLVLGVAGLAVVLVTSHEPDRAAQILGAVKSGEASVGVPSEDAFAARHTTRVRIAVTREEANSFGGTATRRIDVKQTTELTSEAAFVRHSGDGDVWDVRTEGRVTDQTGTIGADDARDAELYPWVGVRTPRRLRTSQGAGFTQFDGAAPVPGFDVPPLFHLDALSAPSRTFRPGDRWKTELVLPILTDRGGRLISWPVPVEVSYAGLATRDGWKCAAFRIDGTAPRTLPTILDDVYNRTSGRISGAVWIETDTGIASGAELDVDLRIWKEAGRVEDDLQIRGRLSLERR